ncbi:hypothetical protein [Streptomyces sp. CB01881]|uniref:hypothetical protein n=1 Tax=Streptomyces sp. CB01881 TaxID=2078691 RepID=UPI000CDC80EE|nr:hypothetical protein [Streptomyces sp. CB01881]AUY53003.1 hypothetical protein C2142_33420 [Streptomyces sp. CB01881]TYC70719.1 hypothetical protein EH183_33480 [Streptomyces sp. CB01881]
MPDDGFVWYTGCRLERLTDDVGTFFTDWVAAPGFRDLAGLGPEDLATSHWYRLLRLTALAS